MNACLKTFSWLQHRNSKASKLYRVFNKLRFLLFSDFLVHHQIDHWIFDDRRESRCNWSTMLHVHGPRVKSNWETVVVGYRVCISTEMQQRAKSRSLAWCALQCDAGSIKQAAIHGATVSRLRVIAGPALGFEHRRKTERERGARQGGQEKRKRTSRRRSRVRKKGIAGDSGGREGEGRGGAVKRVIRARVCARAARDCVRGEPGFLSPSR